MKQEIQPHGGSLTRPEKGETANPNGRPKKSFTLINNKLKENGYEPMTKGQLTEFYSLLFSMDEKAINDMAEDIEAPLSIRLMIQGFTEPQSRDKLMADFRDYLFGKAKESIEAKIQHEGIFKGIELDVIKDNSTI